MPPCTSDLGVAPDAAELATAGESTYELFAASAERHRDRLAVVDRQRRWTYAELAARVEEIATAIDREGVPSQGRVGLALDRTADAVAAVLAVWKCGLAYVPLDVAAPPARMRAVLDDSGARLVLADRAAEVQQLGGVRALDMRLVGSETGPVAACAPGDTAARRRARAANELAYVIYTSGTTGQPKGVLIEHRSLVNLARAHRERIYRHHEPAGRGLRAGLGAALSFDGAVERVLLLLAGHTLFVLDDEERTDPQRYLDYATANDLEALDLTPGFLRALVQCGLLTHETWRPRLALVGGEAIPRPLWMRLAASPIAFYNVYGPTETTVNASVTRIAGDTPHLGRALANTRLYVLKPDGSRAGVCEEGEIHIAGAGVGRGYERLPELTSAKFKSNPFAGGDPVYARMYASGDRGRFRPDGTLEFLGRTDDQIKLRGFRIEPAEITTLLCGCPDVDDAVVRVRTDRDDEDQRLVAYVASATHERHELAERLRQLLRERLPSYMAAGRIVVMERFPLTATGKLDEAALGALDGNGRGDAQGHGDAPRRPAHPPARIDPELVAIWEDVLDTGDIEPDASFFDLGGHSLSAVRMIARVNAAFDVSLPITTVFTAPTIADFDRVLREAPRERTTGRR